MCFGDKNGKTPQCLKPAFFFHFRIENWALSFGTTLWETARAATRFDAIQKVIFNPLFVSISLSSRNLFKLSHRMQECTSLRSKFKGALNPPPQTFISIEGIVWCFFVVLWVLALHCPLNTKQCVLSMNLSNIVRKSWGMPWIEPGAAGWEAQMLDLCCTVPQICDTLSLTLHWKQNFWWRHGQTTCVKRKRG